MKPNPSRVMKTKMPMMKMMAETPPRKTSAWTALSMYQSRLGRSEAARATGGAAIPSREVAAI